MIVRELLTKLGFEVDEAAIDKYEHGFHGIQGALVAATGAAVAMGGTLFGVAAHMSHAGVEIEHMSERLGISTRELQGFEFAARAAGLDSEEFAIGIQHLARMMVEARNGSKEARINFLRLSPAIFQSVMSGADAGTVFKQISQRMGEMGPGAIRTGVAMQVFGRSGARLIPMFEKVNDDFDGFVARLEKLGAILDKEAIEKAEEFKKAFVGLKVVLEGIKNAVGVRILNAVTPVVQAFAMFVQANQEIIASNILAVFDGMATSLSILSRVLGYVVAWVSRLMRLFGGAGNLGKLLAIGFSIFTTGKLLVGIGNVYLALARLIALQAAASGARAAAFGGGLIGYLNVLRQSWLAVGNSALIAEAKMLAIPLAIGAAIAGVLLFFEDLYTYTAGGDSLIGRFIKSFPEISGVIESTIAAPFRGIIALFRDLIDHTLTWKKGLLEAGSTLINSVLTPLRIHAGLSNLKNSLFNPADQGKGITQRISESFSKANDLFSVRPEALAPGGSSSASTDNSQIHISAPVTVHAGGTDSPVQVGAKVSDGVQGGLSSTLRAAKRNLTPAVAH